MKKLTTYLLGLAVMATTAACTGDLDQEPVIGENSGTVYSSIEGYRAVLAKIYGSYTLTGQERGGGNGDLDVEHDLLRNLFYLQEASTDEVAVTWGTGDQLDDISYISWDATNPYISNVYYRLYYSIALCNEFLRYCGEGTISGFPADQQGELRSYAAEARFMRALDYSIVLDLYRQGPFVDENTPTSGVIPEAYDGKQLYDFIIGEIEAITADGQLPEVNSYGRACRAAAWALGARVALNAAVYTGTADYTACVGYCNKVIATGRYSLEADYLKLFNADNDRRTNEIIFGFPADAENATTWGSATHVVCGSCSTAGEDAARFGIDNGWGSWRVRGEIPDLFDRDNDLRYTFYGGYGVDQMQYFTDAISTTTQGFYSGKWSNLTDEGVAASASAVNGCNTDYPMIRLAEVYLTAAEAVLRGGTGMSRSDALGYLNQVRERGYGFTGAGTINDGQFTLDFVLDERARELYHEMMRRTDLVRYDRFTTSDYIWQWKGGMLDGTAVNSRYNVFPIPLTELSANPNLSNANY